MHLTAAPDAVSRVVLLGPAQFWPLDGMAVPAVHAFATPLGVVGVDDDARSAAATLPGVAVDDRPHEGEHSLERPCSTARVFAPARSSTTVSAR